MKNFLTVVLKILNWMLVLFSWIGIGLLVLVIALGFLLVADTYLPSGWTLTPEILVGISAIVLSLVLTFAPGIRTKFATITSGQKALVNLISVTIIAIAMYLGTCLGWYTIPGLSCGEAGLKTLLIDIISGVFGNQITYLASTKPSDVIAATTASKTESASS